MLVVGAGFHISILKFAQHTSESSPATCFVFLKTGSHNSPNWSLLVSHSYSLCLHIPGSGITDPCHHTALCRAGVPQAPGMTAKALPAELLASLLVESSLPGLLVPSSLCLLLSAAAALWSCNLDGQVVVSQMLHTALILLLLPAGHLTTSQSVFLQPLRQELTPSQPLT